MTSLGPSTSGKQPIAVTAESVDAYFRAFVEFALADPKHGPALRAFVERLVR